MSGSDSAAVPEVRLRVGFLIDRWQPERGGAERAMALFAEHLEERGHEVLAFGLVGPRAGHPAPGRFKRVRTYGILRSARERRLARALTLAAAEAECDVTVGVRHLAEVDVYWPHGGSHVETLAAKHGAGQWYSLLSRHRAFLDLEARLFRDGNVQRIVCVSELVRRELSAAFPGNEERLVVIPNGVDLDRFHPRERERSGAELRAGLGLTAQTPLLVHAARNPSLKGLPTLLEALAGGLRSGSWEDLDRPWRLLVAGPARPARWERAARRLGLEGNRVIVRSRADPVAIVAGADLAVQPTRRDPCSLATLEALACGTPVVTTRANGAAEVMTDPSCGTVLADPRDAHALRKAIGEQLDAIDAGRIDRRQIRSAVEERGLDGQLSSLERLVVGVAAEKRR